MKKNSLTLKRERSKQYPAETIMDADNLLQAFQVFDSQKGYNFFHFIAKIEIFQI